MLGAYFNSHNRDLHTGTWLGKKEDDIESLGIVEAKNNEPSLSPNRLDIIQLAV